MKNKAVGDDMKMSDVFELPVDFYMNDEDSQLLADHFCYRALSVAVNNHDRLTTENQALKEQNQKLVEALDNLLWKCVESDSDIADSDAWHTAERLVK